jgi:hypothetical protein
MAKLASHMPVTLPASIQAIVPQLVADNGRERAETLLAILGAGPDWVDNNLTGIDIALGSQGPGLVALQRLVQLTRDASDPNAPKVPRQHLALRTSGHGATRPDVVGLDRRLHPQRSVW